MNMYPDQSENPITLLLRAINAPTRLKILLSIGDGEACVCHLEASLALRQAYISQHLMALREAKVLTTCREGRFIYYSLCDPRLLRLIELAGNIAGITETEIKTITQTSAKTNCPCPKCEAQE